MKRLAIAVSMGFTALALQGCTSLGAKEEEVPVVPTAQDEALARQGMEHKPGRQIQRYVGVRWGNTGRGGAALLQPGYVHVLLGEDDPQGAHAVSYDAALALRDAMTVRDSQLAELRQSQKEAWEIRRAQEASEMDKLMEQLSVDARAVGLKSGVYATEQPSAKEIAASGQNARQAVEAALKRATDQSREIERQRFNQTAEEIDRKMSSMTELMEKDRWIMACAGYHDLLNDGDYAYLMSYGGADAIPDDATPSNCPGLFPNEHLVDQLSAELCPVGDAYSAKHTFYADIFEARGIDVSVYNPVYDMLVPCLGK